MSPLPSFGRLLIRVGRGFPSGHRAGRAVVSRYLFAYGDLATAHLAAARYLPGLGEIVSFDGQPAIVPQPVIAGIQRLAGDLDSDAETERDGLPADLQSALQGAVSPEERAQILLRCLRQAHEIATPSGAPPGVMTTGAKPRLRRGTRGHGRTIHYKD